MHLQIANKGNIYYEKISPCYQSRTLSHCPKLPRSLGQEQKRESDVTKHIKTSKF